MRNLDKQKVLEDLDNGIEILQDVENCITIFGSARLPSDNVYSKKAYELAYKLSKKGISIVTGGGGGIMEAANKGAYEANCAKSIGLNIKLPHEQHANDYTTKSSEFRYFFVRKCMLVEKSNYCIIFPGGFGTMDEMFEVATLIQTQKIKELKVYLYGSDFWNEMLNFLKNTMVKNGVIKEIDLEILQVCDDIDFLVKEITNGKNIGCNERRN